MKAYLLIMITLLFFSFQSHAQFRGLLKKAENKVLDEVLDNNTSDSASPKAQPAAGRPQRHPEEQSQHQEEQNANDQDKENQIKPPPPIDFPVTGKTVEATHCVYQWVLDTAKVVAAIGSTAQGKYAFSLARKKGLKGSDEQLFQQLLDPRNKAVMDEISEEVEAKFPEKDKSKGYVHKRWHNEVWSGEGTVPGGAPVQSENPAWGGVSVPSVYFGALMGTVNVWFTNRYIKAALNEDAYSQSNTYLGLLGLRAIGILDLEHDIDYQIASMFGVKYTMEQKIDTTNPENSWVNSMHAMATANCVFPVSGIKVEAGKPGKFGPYNTVTRKVIIPVKPFVDPRTGKLSNALLRFHDLFSGRDDADPDDHPHYDPAYKIIYVLHYTHDLDHDLPDGFLAKIRSGYFGPERALCVGFQTEDENGNSADFRLTSIQPAGEIDKGQFQVPADYPVMTQAQLNEAVKKQFSLKNLFKKAIQHAGSEDGK